MSARPPVLLLGGINLVRALGLARIPVIVASPQGFTPAMASRYCTGRLSLPPLEQREALVASLMRAAERFGAALPLFYGDDDYLGIVQDFRVTLAKRYLFLLNDPALSRALHSKALFQALAEERGLPIAGRLDYEHLGELRRPVLVKPRMKTGWAESTVHRQLFGGAGKARLFASGREARLDPLVRQLAPELSFQEYIPGDDRALWSFHGFADRKGRVLAWFTGRKIRTYPALTGDSSYLELAHDEKLGELGHEVVARLGLKGVFKIDFKRHAESGQFYVLEVNARFNLWHHLGAKNGVNLAQVAYDYLTGNARPAPQRARSTYRWLCLRLDYKAARSSRIKPWRWLASLAKPKVYDVFAWTDPLPLLVELKGYLPRIRRRMQRWLSTAS
ncbi:MAG TPA: ATP-grasp domain-containing protein [Burkholderiales bacterium]